MMHATLAQLRTLKLDGLAAGLEEQLAQHGMVALGFEERVALLVDREVHVRNDRKLALLLKNEHLKYGQAAIEDIDARSGRGPAWCMKVRRFCHEAERATPDAGSRECAHSISAIGNHLDCGATCMSMEQ